MNIEYNFGSLASFDDFPTEKFKEILENLSKSKDSIDKAAKFVLDNYDSIEDLFDVLLNRMRKCSMNKRISFFYLIDSICQNCFNKKLFYTEFIIANLEEIILLTLTDGVEVDPTKNKDAVEKVLNNWSERKIFDDNIIHRGKILLLDIRENTRSICTNLTEKEINLLLKKLEDDRRDIKKKKYDFENIENHPLQEFIEFWVACNVKLQHLKRNQLNNSTENSSTLTSPDPINSSNSNLDTQNIEIQKCDIELYENFKKKYNLPSWYSYQLDFVDLPNYNPNDFVGTSYNYMNYMDYNNIYYQNNDNNINNNNFNNNKHNENDMNNYNMINNFNTDNNNNNNMNMNMNNNDMNMMNNMNFNDNNNSNNNSNNNNNMYSSNGLNYQNNFNNNYMNQQQFFQPDYSMQNNFDQVMVYPFNHSLIFSNTHYSPKRTSDYDKIQIYLNTI